MLTSLLLAKECGANVDEKTLTNALRYFWRFVGHGGIPYGDHRAEGGIGSNGKDAMIAAAMQVAMRANDWKPCSMNNTGPSFPSGSGRARVVTPR